MLYKHIFCGALLTLVSSLSVPVFAEYSESRHQMLVRHVDHFSEKWSSESAKQFVDRLTRVARTDREKAWLIYRWVTTNFIHDSHAARRIGNPALRDIDELIQFRRGSCEVFAQVTHGLLAIAGLRSKVIVGHANTGQPSKQRRAQINHAWNMVWIDRQWQLMDTTWGAGYVDQSGFTRQQSDLFFMMPRAQADLLYKERPTNQDGSVQNTIDSQPFRNLPPNAAYAAFVGFDSEQVAEEARRGRRVVETFDLPNGSFMVLDAPVSYALKKGAQRFVLRSDQFEKLAVVQGDQWHFFQRASGRFAIELKAKRGELIVMGKRHGQVDYEALLAYKVG